MRSLGIRVTVGINVLGVLLGFIGFAWLEVAYASIPREVGGLIPPAINKTYFCIMYVEQRYVR